MTNVAFQEERSWAAKPLFYHAPEPPPLPGQGKAREYQHAAVEYCLARDNALIGDSPGLGKTCEAILLSNAISARRTLVVCPASLRLNWEREVWRWSTIPNVETYPTLSARDGINPHAHYQIISYDLLRNRAILDALLDVRWDHAIYDEAHFLKDPKGNLRTRAICASDALPSVIGRTTMLSGTILPNQPIEVYNAVRLLDWEAINKASLETFRETYYDFGSGFITGRYTTTDERGDPITKIGSHWSDKVRNVPRNLDDLRSRLRSRIMVRRLMDHVLPELPKTHWHVFPLAPTPAMRKALRHPGWIAAQRLYEMDPAAFDSGIPIDGEISTARRLLGEAKAPEIVDYIHELFREGVTKLVVAAWHRSVLAELHEGLAKLGVVYMDGATSTMKKQAAVDAFQGDPKVGVILGQTQPLGMGWNLTAAQDVVQCEPDWVPGTNDQLLLRIRRFGQKGTRLLGHMPVVPDTLDERVLATAIDKDITIHKALDGDRAPV